MTRRELQIAEKAIRRIAIKEQKSIADVKKEMQKAMFVGLCSQDPVVQTYWRSIPCEGDIPTPEELILFTAGEVLNKKHKKRL